jgi:hypothetical protein
MLGEQGNEASVSFVPLSAYSSSSIESCTSPVLVDHHPEDNWSCKLLSCALSIQHYLMFVDGLITRVRVFMA